MTKKKKVLSVALAAVIAAVGIAGGSLAYFTDTDKATNTFTTGNVKIDLVEKNGDGTAFTQDQVLLPGEENAIVKDVTVKNVGTNDAYMWIEMWIPSALDNTSAANNSLHFNPFDTYKLPDGDTKPMRGSIAKAAGGVIVAETNCVNIGTKTIGEGEKAQMYTGYRINIVGDTAKKTNESTASLLYRVFMDQRVAQGTNGYILTDGTTDYTGSWEIIVDAYGIQADGFDSIEKAMEAYYNA